MPAPTKHHVLLTGANGFIATHILDQLLSANHTVLCTVRSASKAASLGATFPSFSPPNLTIAVIPDLTAPNAFSPFFVPHPSLPAIDTVLHTASPFLYKAATSSNAADFLDPAIIGTKNLLAAARTAPAVRRVVMTSSCAAVIDYVREATPGVARKVYVEGDWNDVTYRQGEEGDKSTAYRASKKLGELAAWDFVGGLNANGDGAAGGGDARFDLVVLCPPAVQGPVRGKVGRIDELGESNARFWKLFVDSRKDAEIANKMPLHVYVDVRDLARAHILAMTVPEAGNKRFLICAGSFSNRDVTDALRKEIPELEERTPVGKPGSGLSENDYGYSSERAKKVLGLTYRPKEETFVELARQLLEIEKREKENEERK